MTNQIILSNVPRMTIFASLPSRAVDFALGTPECFCRNHFHEEIELVVVKTGAIRFTVDGKDYDAFAGDIVFVNSGVAHATEKIASPSITGLIQFKKSDFMYADDPQIINYSAQFKILSETPVAVIRDKRLFRSTMNIFKETREKSPAYDMYVRSEIFNILGFLQRNGYIMTADKLMENRAARKIKPILSHINTNYNEDITLEYASKALNFDTSYFCRIFKEATGATFTEYLNFVRICNAQKLLTRTDKSILEISEAVGFSSVSYFNRIFKKYKNCSPRYYRRARCNENI